MRRRVQKTRFVLVGMLALVVLLGPGLTEISAGVRDSREPGTQVVTATDGMYAWGASGYLEFPDGSTRWFTAMLAVPDGMIVGSPPVEDADLREPWAVVSERAWVTDTSGGGLTGGPEVCHELVNPERWQRGRPGSTRQVAAGTRPSWEDVSFDITCDDGAGYDFYRIYFDRWTYRNGNQSFVHEPGTLGHPQTDVRYWGWSAPYRVNGLLEADPAGIQSSAMTVCGHRDVGRANDEVERVVDCYGPGLGRIVPEVDLLTTQLYVALE